jgi:hypothetical protein
VDVARDDLAETVGHADEGLLDIRLADAAGVEQAAVRRPLETFLDRITSHHGLSPKP